MLSISEAAGVTAVVVVVICGINWITTSWEFTTAVRNANNATKDKPSKPPALPYAIPGLGNTLSFATQNTGSFWDFLLAKCGHYKLDAASILLSGTRTYFILPDSGVQSIFKSRQLTRFDLDRTFGRNVLGLSAEEAVKLFPSDLNPKEELTPERIHSDHLLNTSAVDVLTRKFIELFSRNISQNDTLDQGIEVNLYQWLQEQWLYASTSALYGTKLLELTPDLAEHFWRWDEGLLALLFGTPKGFVRQAYAARDRVLDELEIWLHEGYAARPADPVSDPGWVPFFGARVVRERHEYYRQQNLRVRAQAGADLAFLGGILSNAIPSTGWVLMHLLSPESSAQLLPDVIEELERAQRSDGTLDVQTLVSLPKLNCVVLEVLRLYVDLLVTRQVDTNIALGHHNVKKGGMVMAASWMGHRNPSFFDGPNEFRPERYLRMDTESGEQTFSTTGLNDKYFPFGGGHYMCPGRTFAKQEVLSAVAIVLLKLDIEFMEFVRPHKDGFRGLGHHSTGFPELKKGYAGNVVVGLDGDMRVRMKRRSDGWTVNGQQHDLPN